MEVLLKQMMLIQTSQKLMEIIEKVGPDKNKGIKRNSQAWLDSEVS